MLEEWLGDGDDDEHAVAVGAGDELADTHAEAEALAHEDAD